MTNEEAIENLENDIKRYSKKEFDENTSSLGLQSVLKHRKEKLESYEIAINAIQENTKLKAEIEVLIDEIEQVREYGKFMESKYYDRLEKFHNLDSKNLELNKDIEQLKEFIDRLNNIHEQRLSGMMKEITELKGEMELVKNEKEI